LEEPQLKRELGLARATMLGIGGTLSAGNFVIIGYAASLAGYAIVPVVFGCGIISLFTMLSYAELGTAIPLAGGEYTWVKVAYGGFIGFLTGWFEWLSNMFYAALSAIGVAYVTAYLFPQINIPIVAVLVVIAFSIINLKGIKETSNAQTVVAALVLGILGIFILTGLPSVQGAQSTISPSLGLVGIFAATAYLFELYLGAEAVAAAQAEIKNPGRNIPIAIVLSAIVLISLYTALVFVAVGIVPPDILSQQSSPIAFVAEQLLGPAGGVLITVGLAIAGLAATNEAILAQSHVLYAMSRDGYLPKGLCKIHKRFCTPHIAVIVSAFFTVILTATGLVNFVVYAVNLGFMVGFTIVNFSLIKLRKTAPHLKRHFKVPLYPLTPLAGIVTAAFLLIFIEPDVLILGLELGVIALLVYYIRMVGYSRIRVAFGGISMGLGFFTAIVACLLWNNMIVLQGASPLVKQIIFWLLVLASAIQFAAGLLNVTASDRC
jgi:APA family basic amino acid/polyamine antiporter